jgi:N,N'-diacetyllegionaminate synthase
MSQFSDNFFPSVNRGPQPHERRPQAKKCLVVAEVGQAHDGSLGMAHAYIDAIAAAGADVVKFQTHIAAAESTPGEPWRVKFSRQDASRFDYWKRMEFSEPQWHELKRHADEKGLLFLSSPFSLEAVDLLERVGTVAWKVASGEVNNSQLLKRIVRTGIPIIFSTGMSDLATVDEAVALVKKSGVPLAVLQCTTAYPCPPEKVGINLLSFFKDRYQCAVGLSDHSGTIYPSLAAVTLGAELLEIHVTFDRGMFGPDVPASVTTTELKQLVEGIGFIEKMLAHPVDKNEMAHEMAEVRTIFGKSLVARTDLEIGTVLTEENLTSKKPGTGIPIARLPEVVGARLTRAVKAGEILSIKDIGA